ncbi:serine hydrolase domain-containing protein [Shewanella waksmanii]|uniref:serine hydrolase domain-containing protein n=1 Tax=Shewanella waksmanii TaxID=213783 RepID=UPI00048DC098|nr:serine hydrolase domain-containing protein [Shewanella waksmanii]
MIKVFVTSIALMLLFPPFAYGTTAPVADKLNQHIQHYVEDEKFQGAVLLAQQGKVLFKQAYGYADIENEIPNTTQHQFLIGSMTKSFTAVAVMRLVEQNKLDLHAPIATYIPKLDSKLASGLTLHLLLKHQSGLTRHLEHLASFEEKDVTSSEILGIINTSEQSFKPGTQYEYGNLNYHLIALIIENVTGKSYAEAMHTLVFAPLEMQHSGVERIANPPKNRANGYRKSVFGINRDENIVSYALGSGDIYSTVEDLLKWEQALYTPGFLSQQSIDLMFKGENKALGYYGYGFRIREYQRSREHNNLGKLTRHGGSMDGFSSNLHRYTDDQLTVIILANVRRFSIRTLTFELKEIALGVDSMQRSRSSFE